MLGYPSEARRSRFARSRLRYLFPYLFPHLLLQPRYNTRLRKLTATLTWVSGHLGVSVQLDLERPGGRTTAGVCAWISQRILALTIAIWHKDLIGAPIRAH